MIDNRPPIASRISALLSTLLSFFFSALFDTKSFFFQSFIIFPVYLNTLTKRPMREALVVPSHTSSPVVEYLHRTFLMVLGWASVIWWASSSSVRDKADLETAVDSRDIYKDIKMVEMFWINQQRLWMMRLRRIKNSNPGLCSTQPTAIPWGCRLTNPPTSPNHRPEITPESLSH